MGSPDEPDRPWYRHFWVWFLMVPPAATVVFWTVVLATTAASPSLVVDDYARIGLVYEAERERDRAAARRGIRARIHVTRDDGGVTVALTGLDVPPDRLAVRLAHPTDASRDLRATLERSGSGIYRGSLGAPAPGRRYVQIQPPDASWRLGGELLAGQADMALEPPEPIAAR